MAAKKPDNVVYNEEEQRYDPVQGGARAADRRPEEDGVHRMPGASEEAVRH